MLPRCKKKVQKRTRNYQFHLEFGHFQVSGLFRTEYFQITWTLTAGRAGPPAAPIALPATPRALTLSSLPVLWAFRFSHSQI